MFVYMCTVHNVTLIVEWCTFECIHNIVKWCTIYERVHMFIFWIYIAYICRLMHFKYMFIFRRLRYIQHYTGIPEIKIITITCVQFLKVWCLLVYVYYLPTLIIFKSTNAFSWELVCVCVCDAVWVYSA
jgi:hypothetical protein